MTAFDNQRYIEAQNKVLDQLDTSGCQLWCIEVGGKLIQDKHAARVLPGFDEDVRFEFVKSMSSQCDVVMVVSAQDIARKRIRGDFQTTYDEETFRSITELTKRGLHIHHIAVSRMTEDAKNNQLVQNFLLHLEESQLSFSVHYDIENYTSVELNEDDISYSPEIVCNKNRVIVISPGGGSGKFGICLTILYQAMKKGLHPNYFSIGAFPIYELPITHPLNLAYLAATADFSDDLISDPDSPDTIVTAREQNNYNLLKKITSFFPKESEYLQTITSATAMCINMLQKGILDEELVRKEASAEIARRYMRYKIEGEKNQENPAVALRVKKLFDLL